MKTLLPNYYNFENCGASRQKYKKRNNSSLLGKKKNRTNKNTVTVASCVLSAVFPCWCGCDRGWQAVLVAQARQRRCRDAAVTHSSPARALQGELGTSSGVMTASGKREGRNDSPETHTGSNWFWLYHAAARRSRESRQILSEC